MGLLELAGLALAGFAIGVYATSIGAGGGFLLAPLLLLRYPDASPAEVTMAALSVVVLSSGLSATLAERAHRVDRPVAGMLTAAALPAGLLGALGTSLLPRSLFAAVFAALLLSTGLYLVWRPAARYLDPVRHGWFREFTDGEGNTFHYRVPVRRSIFATATAAFCAALAGVGGGLIYTPLATRMMRIPHSLAVPLAYVVNTGMALTVVAFHAATSHTGDPLRDVPPLGIGVLAATPIGRRANRRLGEGPLTRFLAAGLIVVSLRTALIAW